MDIDIVWQLDGSMAQFPTPYMSVMERRGTWET